MKSETEKKFDEVSRTYFEKFNKKYPLIITDGESLEWHINKMQECIKSGKPYKVKLQKDAIY